MSKSQASGHSSRRYIQADAAPAAPATSAPDAAPASTAKPAGKPTAKAAAAGDSRRTQVRLSGVHGKGVYAVQDLAEGETLLEYKGEVITWPEALRRHPHDPANPNHTFYFHIDEEHVIDGKHGGNSARWINHSCAPNCEADEDGGRVFIKTLRNIPAGEELFYDYGLIIDAKYTKKLLADYPCWCGAPDCRGTLLAPKDEDGKKKKRKTLAGKSRKKAKGEKADKKSVKKADKDGKKASDKSSAKSGKKKNKKD